MAVPRSDFAACFGANLARARHRTDLSQEELAIRAELHRTAIGQLERGERVARADTLFKLASVLVVSPSSFFDGIVWRSGCYEPGGFDIPRSTGEVDDRKNAATTLKSTPWSSPGFDDT